jgi:hypothetical protein
MEVLERLNREPAAFLSGIRKRISTASGNFPIAKDRMHGGLIVWGNDETYKFAWDKAKEVWT